MKGEMDAEWFGEAFEGLTVTLMGSHPLRRELALLRAGMPPSSREDAPIRPFLGADERVELTLPLIDLLPSMHPGSVSDLRDRLSPLPRNKSELVRRLIDEAWRLLRGWPEPAQLWLVPALWNHRMAFLLETQFFPASVRSFGVCLPWRSAD